MKKALSTVFLMTLVLSLYAIIAQAIPQGPTGFSTGAPERRTTAVGSNAGELIQAQAGNFTSLNINTTQVSGRWQGFYGNVTGVITLDDAGNFTLYTWQQTDVEGEVYAVNSSVIPNWNNVVCFNFTKTSSEQNVTLAQLEANLGMGTNDVDGVNETFNQQFTGNFNVGSVTIDINDGCSAVSLFTNDGGDQTFFNETILTDNSTKIIYASIIEQNQQGYTGAPMDFQMIVGENGDIAAATDYYFYVELS